LSGFFRRAIGKSLIGRKRLRRGSAAGCEVCVVTIVDTHFHRRARRTWIKNRRRNSTPETSPGDPQLYLAMIAAASVGGGGDFVLRVSARDKNF